MFLCALAQHGSFLVWYLLAVSFFFTSCHAKHFKRFSGATGVFLKAANDMFLSSKTHVILLQCFKRLPMRFIVITALF